MQIRRAKPTDAAALAEIYNYYIKNSHATFETSEITAAEMERRLAESENSGHPFLVAAGSAQVIGFAYARRFRPREAYRHSAEVSVYLRNGNEAKGTGTLLYKTLIPELANLDFHTIIAGISLPNEASIKLHERFGFEKVAHFREVGNKFGKWIDVAYWQLIITK